MRFDRYFCHSLTADYLVIFVLILESKWRLKANIEFIIKMIGDVR